VKVENRRVFPVRSFALLAIENARDHVVGVMNSKTTKERDRIFVSGWAMRLKARQGEI
jgi:hypothetical protein